MPETQTTRICGYDLVVADRTACRELIKSRISQGQGAWIVTLNLEMVSRGAKQPEYRDLIMQSDLMYADGMPLVWGSKKKPGATPLPERVTGSDLTLKLLQEVDPNLIAIIGGENPEMALKHAEIPDFEKIYVDNGIISLEQEAVAKMVELLKDRRLVFLALGVPKQDRLALALRPLLPEAILIGVGGSFELIAGIKPRAPLWMQNAGLEWLFRLLAEPKRLWHRYLVEYWAGVKALARDIRKPI